MSTAQVNGATPAIVTPRDKAALLERVVVTGDLAQLQAAERVSYYHAVCDSVGLNPLTQPFEYITLNGKMKLYALKGATDQLREIHAVSISSPKVQIEDGLCIVSVEARDKQGRTDSDVGAVAIANLKGDAKANAIMKAITKAKRRVTLSICGLGMLDESEVETIPGARIGDAEKPLADQLAEQFNAQSKPKRPAPPEAEIPDRVQRQLEDIGMATPATLKNGIDEAAATIADAPPERQPWLRWLVGCSLEQLLFLAQSKAELEGVGKSIPAINEGVQLGKPWLDYLRAKYEARTKEGGMK